MHDIKADKHKELTGRMRERKNKNNRQGKQKRRERPPKISSDHASGTHEA